MQRQASTGASILDAPRFGAAADSREILRGESLSKTFRSGAHEITPLQKLNFSIERGEMVAVVGPSGTGKSTLLHLLAALDTPTSGTVYFAGNSLRSLSEAQLAEYRNRVVGFVWQRHHLLPDFTAAENIAMPMLLSGTSLDEALKAAREWLGEVGLASREGQRTGELSGGEQQRVAIARALVNHPAVLLADEPTGDLDEMSAESVFELMQRLHRSYQLTSILATHNQSLARRADRILVLEHGDLAPGLKAFAGTAASPAEPAGAESRALGERG
jgi:lipoprotein-releasing system ATP-binding protein